MKPEQIVFLAFLAFAAGIVIIAALAIVLRIGRYLGSREDHERAYLGGYAAGRRDERADQARDPLMPRTWCDEAGYPPLIAEDLPDGSARVSTGGTPR